MDKQSILVGFGAAVAARRKEKGISQERLAEIVGLHRTYVGAVERGERNCTLTTIFRIAEGLNWSPEELVRNGMFATQ